ncbi:MAG: L-threonylcarbamoyladenylate synthase [Planctomycetota bacterium]
MAVSTQLLDGNNPADLARAADLLRQGELVAMPTETVYGLAGHALDPAAVARIFQAKQRPSFDPLIVHTPSLASAHRLASLDPTALKLAERFWPGPLTLVLPRGPAVPDLVTSGLETVGLRVPAHPVAQALLRAADVPLAAPSANRFGAISPTTAAHVRQELDGRIAAVLDGGPCERGVESTVVRVINNRCTVLRLGALPVESIEPIVGDLQLAEPSSSPGKANGTAPRPAPGMTDRHYAPRTALSVLDSIDQLAKLDTDSKRIGLLYLGSLEDVGDATAQFAVRRSLSERGDLAEAAANLFDTLRGLDAAGLDRIIALRMPNEGLGRAINDRLRRGSV